MSILNILYASEMGNAIDVAEEVYSLAKKSNIKVNKFEMNDVSMEELEKMKKTIFITSTTGDGDIPMMGETFWEDLNSSNIILKSMEYGVCALGDSSYFDFCGAGKKIDSKIQELGAKSVIKRHECDFDLEGWEDWAIKTFKELSLL